MEIDADTRFDICRDHRLDQILKNEFGLEETKKGLLEYFSKALGNFLEDSLEVDDDENPTVIGLRDDITYIENENADLAKENRKLKDEVTRLRDDIKRLEAAKQEG